MKQLLPSKMVEAEESVRYSSSEVGRLAGRGAVPRIHAEPAGMCAPLCLRSNAAVSARRLMHRGGLSSRVRPASGERRHHVGGPVHL